MFFLNYIVLKDHHEIKGFQYFSERIQGNRAIPQIIGTFVVFFTYLLALSPLFLPEQLNYTKCQNSKSKLELRDCQKDFIILEVSFAHESFLPNSFRFPDLVRPDKIAQKNNSNVLFRKLTLILLKFLNNGVIDLGGSHSSFNAIKIKTFI